MVEMVTQLIIIAILVEALTEVFKSIFKDGRLDKSSILSIVIGLILAFTINLDLFVAIGLVPTIPFIGVVATGLLISRGANFVHDTMSKVGNKGVK